MKEAILFIIFVISLGCAEERRDEAGCLHVPVPAQFQPLQADSLFSAVDYILLETNGNSLLTDIDKLDMTEDRIYILDRRQGVLMQFDRDGKFISKLDRKGRGKGEYPRLDDFFIEDSLVYILSSDIRKILIYDKQFDFIADFTIDSYATNMTCLKDTLFLFTNFSSPELTNFYAYHLREGKVLNRFHPFLEKQKGVGYTQTTFAEYNNEIYGFLPFDFSIYKLSAAGTERIYRLDFGRQNSCPQGFKDFSDEERMDYCKRYSDFSEFPIQSIDNLFIDDHLFFFTFVKGIFPYCYIRKGNKKWVGSFVPAKAFPVANNKVLWVDKNKFCTYEWAETFLRCKEKEEAFPFDCGQWNIDDNPVLCIYRFK